MLAGSGIEPLFPIWGEDTTALSRWVVANGFKATIVSVDPKQVPGTLAARAYDNALLDELPEGADPCAERGEFHTFVHDAPNFRAPIPVAAGEIVERDGFVFADLLPA
jgi:diphthamide synthase (EF-2-diphthine--ammonia ligase)